MPVDKTQKALLEDFNRRLPLILFLNDFHLPFFLLSVPPKDSGSESIFRGELSNLHKLNFHISGC